MKGFLQESSLLITSITVITLPWKYIISHSQGTPYNKCTQKNAKYTFRIKLVIEQDFSFCIKNTTLVEDSCLLIPKTISSIFSFFHTFMKCFAIFFEPLIWLSYTMATAPSCYAGNV